MGLLKFLVVGAAVAYGINYVTKKGPDGKSIIDDLAENGPEWMDRAKKYGELTLEQIAARAQNFRDSSRF
jgi:predicted oxidoreductase